jgi:hypothetical protein
VLRKRPDGLLDGEISGGRAMMETFLEEARAKELLYMIPPAAAARPCEKVKMHNESRQHNTCVVLLFIVLIMSELSCHYAKGLE